MDMRHEIINYLIEKYSYKTYLEIGCQKQRCFKQIKCETKHSVDPNWPAMYKTTSDGFFDKLDREGDTIKYDLIFIDGDHCESAVAKDIENSLRYLSGKGLILVHDMSPDNEKFARSKPLKTAPVWYGDGFKVLMRLRSTNPHLFVRTIDTDRGIGVIRPTCGRQKLTDVSEFSYEVMDQDRRETIGLISVDEFVEIFGQ